MRTAFRKSFLKDISALSDEKLRGRLVMVIQEVEAAKRLADIHNIKPLTGHPSFYRIRLGMYRIGVVLQEDVVVFVRFLHRKDVYRYFP